MKNIIMTSVTFISVCFLFFGGCALVDDLGNFQISGAVIALLGGLNLFFISRRTEFE